MWLEYFFTDLFLAGDSGNLYAPATGGNSNFPGNEGKGKYGNEPVERSVPEFQYQIRRGRHRGFDRAGRRMVQRPILGALLPADGEKARRADLQLHCRRCVAPRVADADSVRMAL